MHAGFSLHTSATVSVVVATVVVVVVVVVVVYRVPLFSNTDFP